MLSWESALFIIVQMVNDQLIFHLFAMLRHKTAFTVKFSLLTMHCLSFHDKRSKVARHADYAPLLRKRAQEQLYSDLEDERRRSCRPSQFNHSARFAYPRTSSFALRNGDHNGNDSLDRVSNLRAAVCQIYWAGNSNHFMILESHVPTLCSTCNVLFFYQ